MIVIDLRELAPWEEIIDRAMLLSDQGLHYEDIATELGVGRNQVTKAIEAWHAERGLPVPDGRSRWRKLDACASAAASAR